MWISHDCHFRAPAGGFTVFGVLTRAIQVGERYFDKVHMLLPLR